MSFTDNKVITNSIPQINKNLIPKNKFNNYKIQGEYFDGITFKPVNILIDTRANENYISHKLCTNLQRYPLDNPHQYVNFNGELHEINTVVETLLKFGSEIITIRLLIENEGFNIFMLGITFLENVKPYQITSYGIKITHQGKQVLTNATNTYIHIRFYNQHINPKIRY